MFVYQIADEWVVLQYDYLGMHWGFGSLSELIPQHVLDIQISMLDAIDYQTQVEKCLFIH